MTTIILKTSTDEVVVDFDDQAEIVWTDELRTAYEYEVAYAAMGGTTSQLGKFVDRWESQIPHRIETMMYGLPNTMSAIAFTVQYMEHVMDAIYPGWNNMMTDADFSAEDRMIAWCVRAAARFTNDPYSAVALDDLNGVRAANHNYQSFHVIDSVIRRDLMRACELMLDKMKMTLSSRSMGVRIDARPHSLISVLESFWMAIVLYKSYGGIKPVEALHTGVYFRNKKEQEASLLRRLIAVVHDAQFERVSEGSP